MKKKNINSAVNTIGGKQPNTANTVERDARSSSSAPISVVIVKDAAGCEVATIPVNPDEAYNVIKGLTIIGTSLIRVLRLSPHLEIHILKDTEDTPEYEKRGDSKLFGPIPNSRDFAALMGDIMMED